VCEKAYEQLKRIDEAAKAAKPRATDPVSIKGFLKEKFGDLNETVLSHAAACCCALVQAKEWDPTVWEKHMEPYLKLVTDSQPVKDFAKPFSEKMEEEARPAEEEEDADAAELLCDCKFTLAYGSKILLHNTNLKLRRGLKYGLLGGNDSGVALSLSLRPDWWRPSPLSRARRSLP
jgi:elongation factor 3